MGELLDTLGRDKGELIRSIDWNDLIRAVEQLEKDLGTRMNDLSISMDDRFTEVTGEVARQDDELSEVDGRLVTAQAELAEARARIDALEQHIRRVTLRTERLNYAIGELAEITSRITDLEGEPLQLGTASERPWIDFVTAWGQLKPAPGFTSIGGAGDRTISVRVNAEGEAKVLLRAEHAEGFTVEAEAEVEAALTTHIPTENRSIVATILASNTPLEARERGAFRLLSTEYDRTDARNVQEYVDTYYLKNASAVGGRKSTSFFHSWRDYRSTVMAFAKTDADPRTPDANLGACSIQVTFRDWIAPWIHLDYFLETPVLAESFAEVIGGLVTSNYRDTALAVTDRIGELVQNRGVIGKQRNYRALADAIEQVQVINPPTYLEGFKTSVKNGLLVQQGIEYGQSIGLGQSQEAVAVNAFTGTGQLVDQMTHAVEDAVNAQVDQKLGATEARIETSVSESQANFMDEFFAANGSFRLMENTVQKLAADVDSVEAAVHEKADMLVVTRFLENR